MRFLLIAVVFLATAILCSAADVECKYRKSRNLVLHWADPTDCTRYYRCTNRSVKREVVCAEGKAYNPKTGKCSSNKKSLCKLTLLAPLAGAINPCADEVSGTYTAQPGYCRNFYICNNNQSYPQVCDAGSLFNATLGYCIPDSNTKCWQNNCIGKQNGTYLPDLSSCTSFYVCAGGETTLQKCDSGSYFNSSSNICQPDPNGDFCWENLCVDKNNGDFVKDINDCHSYYVCASGQAVLQHCPEGSYFNWCENGCVPGECPSDETTTTTEYPTTETTISTTECNKETTESSTPTQCTEVTTAATEAPCECPGGYKEGELVPFPHYPENCDKYYECLKGKLEEKECGVGNRFNSTLGVCEPDTDHVCWPTTSTPCAEVTTPTIEPTCGCPGGYKEGELVPFPHYPENCDKYYECLNGKLEEKECGEGNRFNSTLGACEPDVEKVCSPGDCNDHNSIAGAHRVRRSITREQVAPETDINSCIERQVIGHSTDCRKYHVCVNGGLVLQDCGFGNYFDPIMLTCNIDIQRVCIFDHEPINGAKHDNSIEYDSNLEESNTIQVSSSSERVGENMKLVDIISTSDCTCPGGYREGELLPFPNYPENCDKYYVCANGTLREHECGVGNRFDGTLGICQPDTDNTCWPAESNCTCPGGYKEGELLPFPNYPENCNKYYICLKGRLEERECGVGNSFNGNLGVCEPDLNNVCWPNICKNQTDGTALEDPTNCTSFYICENGIGQIYECPPEKWFDPKRKACLADYNATCINPCKDITGITFLPNPDCSKYFLCNDGKAYVETCLKGGFDVTLNKCEEDAVCEATMCVGKDDGTTFPMAGNDTKFYLCLDGEAEIYDCPSGKTFNAAVGICLERPSSQCNQTKCSPLNLDDNAFAPLTDTDDSAFCLCRDGAAFLHHCADNYTFNAAIGVCYSNAPCDPEVCEALPENTRSQNRNDTHSFCLCVSKQQVIVDCPNNQTYNPVTQLCQELDDKCSPTFCFTASEYTTFPALDNNTDGFCECISTGNIFKLCGDGKQFNANIGICLPTTQEACSDALCVGNSGMIFGAFGDPHSFCYCTSEGVAVKQTCPNSEIFNETLLICEATGCNGQICLTNPTGPFPALNEPYSFCICGSTDPSSVTKHSCSNGTRFDPYYSICKADPCDKSFCSVATNDGVPYPANNYPQGFCVCTSGVPTLHLCSEGSVFNADKNICESMTILECDIRECANATGDYMYPVAAKNNSHGFCYCFSQTEVEFFVCPGDALYDPQRGICGVSEEPTESPEQPGDDCTCPGGYTDGQVLPNPTNCRLYYVCNHGRLQEFDCGQGNFFDKASLTCQPLNRRLRQGQSQLKRSEVIPEDNNLCVESDKKHVHSNCSQYEICIDGVWTRLTCTDDRYYNAEQRKCLEPRDDTICMYARVKNLPTCNTLMDQRTTTNRELNCTQYYRCSHGKWRLKSCPKQHFYAKHLSTCIRSSYDDACSARQELESDLAMPQNLNSTSSKCRHMAVRRFKPNCRKYLMCLEDKWWHQYCPLGMYYNNTYNYCMPNTNGQCSSTMSIQTNANSQLEFITPSCDLQGALRPSALACDRFYECQSGSWVLKKCARNQYFNATEGLCLTDKLKFCLESNEVNCTEGERREFPFNCTAFEMCVDGKWQRNDCKSGFMFNDILNMCTINDGSCAENGLRKVCRKWEVKPHLLSENCTQFYYCFNDSWSEGTCLKGHTYSKELGECVPNAANEKCQPSTEEESTSIVISSNVSAQLEFGTICHGLEDGSAVRHPYSCLHFFICFREVAISEQKCIKGSFFDAKLSYCRPNDGTCLIPLGGVCENATDGGNVPHPKDCQAFYQCSTLIGTELLYCAEGEYYNIATGQCQIDQGECRTKYSYKDNSKCADVDHGKHIAHERFCNIYFACVRGLTIPAMCPPEHHFNMTVGRCVSDVKLNCENGTLLNIINELNSFYGCENLNDGHYLPDTADCTKYYVCSGGMKVAKRCSLGTYFDSEQGLCAPDDGSCPYIEKKQPNLLLAPPNPSVCEGKHGTILPNSIDCKEFYVCINGKLRQERCYTNYYFNSSLLQCQRYQLDVENTTLVDTVSGSAHQSKVIQNRLECKNEILNNTQLCLQMPQRSSLAEEGDCRRYIYCNDDGQPVSQRCRNGESYDSLLGFCRQNDGTCLLENGQRVGECKGRHGELVRNSDDCSGYFVCIHGQKIAGYCKENEYYDKIQSKCIADIDNHCGEGTTQMSEMQAVSCLGLSTSVLYPYIFDDCRSYFQCVNGIPKVQKCADGLYFNVTITRCVKEISNCTAPVVNLKRAPERITLRQEDICEKALPGHRYANTDDHCHSFYVCEEDGNAIRTNCAFDELYNAETGACEPSSQVVCKSNPLL